MKTIRIILLILIIIGLIAIATRNMWVPQLVDRIIAMEGVPTPLPLVLHSAPQTSTQAVPPLADGEQCYSYDQVATAQAPYDVREKLDITIKAGVVTGTKTGTQNGPDMTNGYTGTIKGTVTNNVINDVYSYIVEGSHNQEQEIYRASVTGLERLRYPLLEGTGVLKPDLTQPYTVMTYSRVPCGSSD